MRLEVNLRTVCEGGAGAWAVRFFRHLYPKAAIPENLANHTPDDVTRCIGRVLIGRSPIMQISEPIQRLPRKLQECLRGLLSGLLIISLRRIEECRAFYRAFSDFEVQSLKKLLSGNEDFSFQCGERFRLPGQAQRFQSVICNIAFGEDHCCNFSLPFRWLESGSPFMPVLGVG